MDKYTLMGLLSWFVSICIVGFQGIRSLMRTNNAWHDITLWDSGNHCIQHIPYYVHSPFLQKYLIYLIDDCPLYRLLLVAGIIFFIIGAFSNK